MCARSMKCMHQFLHAILAYVHGAIGLSVITHQPIHMHIKAPLLQELFYIQVIGTGNFTYIHRSLWMLHPFLNLVLILCDTDFE